MVSCFRLGGSPLRSMREGESMSDTRESDGEVQVEEPVPGVFHLVYIGRVRASFASELLSGFDAAVARGSKVVLLADAERITGYDTEFREKFTAWFKAN